MNSGIKRNRVLFGGALYRVCRVTWSTVSLRRSYIGTRAVPLLVSLALTACASDGFRTAVANFATTTEAVTAQQIVLQQQQFERRANDIAEELANQRVELVLSDGCAPLSTDTNVNQCVVKRRDGKHLESPYSAVHLTNLRIALGKYTSNLALLAAGAADSDAAFRKQVDSFATSLGGLSGAVESATGTTPPKEKDYTFAANIVAEIGSLYFEYQRVKALKKIIVKTNPVVQAATGYLAQTDFILVDATNFAMLANLSAAEEEVKKLTNDPKATTAKIRKAQLDLIAKTEAYRLDFRDPEKSKLAFTELANAHDKLAKAAESPWSNKEDLRAAFQRIFAAAKSIQPAVKVRFGEDDGES